MPPKKAKRAAGDNISVGKRQHVRRNIAEARPYVHQPLSAPTYHLTHSKTRKRGSHRPSRDAQREETFVIAQEALSRHSEYFEDILALKKAGSGAYEVCLMDAEFEIFNIFRHFVTSGRIYSAHDDDFSAADSGSEGGGTDREWGRLIDAWVLGERLQSCSFKDAVVDTIIDKVVKEDCYSPDMHEDIYPQSNQRSAIRKLVVDMSIWAHAEDTLARQQYSKTMSRFYYDLAVALNSVKDGGMSKKAPYQGRDTCHYHEHGLEGKPCYKTMF